MKLRNTIRLAVTIYFFAALLVGCGRSGGVVQETDEYSFDDVASQIAAEEAASKQAREKSR